MGNGFTLIFIASCPTGFISLYLQSYWLSKTKRDSILEKQEHVRLCNSENILPTPLPYMELK